MLFQNLLLFFSVQMKWKIFFLMLITKPFLVPIDFFLYVLKQIQCKLLGI